VGIAILPIHPLEVGAGDDVPEMLDDAVGNECLAVIVEVDAPGVGCAMRDDFEDLPRRVVPPDAAVEEYAVLFGRPRLADLRARLDAIAAVEPAVRPPGEGVEDVV